MSIEKYTTEGIVLESYDQGEHDRVYKVFTREFGLLLCHAKSIRKLESKLRAHVLPRTVGLFTLVKGRELWRLVGGERVQIDGMYGGEVTNLLNRMVRGDGVHKVLYDRVLSFLKKGYLYNKEEAKLLLYFIILVELGYADAKAIGVRTIKEYISLDVDDLYTRLLLTKGVVKKHVREVLNEIHV